MDSFQWGDHYVTGLAEVDRQHRQLVDVLNRFGELVMRSGGASYNDLDAVFNQLAEYATYHFAEEETLMAEAAVDPRHAKCHQDEHANFLQEVTQLRAGISLVR